MSPDCLSGTQVAPAVAGTVPPAVPVQRIVETERATELGPDAIRT